MSTDPSTDRFYLGVDTGATKTHALITDRAGIVKAFVSGGPGNPQSIGGYGALEKLLSDLVKKACEAAGIAVKDIRAAGLGLAGYDWPSEKEHFYQIARNIGLPERTALVNDAGLGIDAGTTAWPRAPVSTAAGAVRMAGKPLPSATASAGARERALWNWRSKLPSPSLRSTP
jgi:hypothetical protein